MMITTLSLFLSLLLLFVSTPSFAYYSPYYKRIQYAHPQPNYLYYYPPPSHYYYSPYPTAAAHLPASPYATYSAMFSNPMPSTWYEAPSSHDDLNEFYQNIPDATSLLETATNTDGHQQQQQQQRQQQGTKKYDFRFLQEYSTIKDQERQKMMEQQKAKASARESARASAQTGSGNFPEQEWTYKDVKNPPAWLVPKQMQPPGLPLTKPPPVPQMVPPPPPFPPSLDNKGPYAGQGEDTSPPAPTYAMPRPPPAELPRWIPWSAYYVPDLDPAGEQAQQQRAQRS